MTIDWLNILTTVGFPIALVIALGKYIGKYTPDVIKGVMDFVAAIRDLSQAVDRNTIITQRHYDENITVQEHLRRAIALLEDHHENAVEIQEDLNELRLLFVELAERIQEMEMK